MGVYVLWEISRKNCDSTLGARTHPCINKFITGGNRKMERWPGRWRTVLKHSTSNSPQQCRVQEPVHYVCDGKAMRYMPTDHTSQPPCLQLAPTASCPGASPPFLRMYKRVMSMTTPVMNIMPLLWISCPCYKYHTPVTGITPLSRVWPLTCRVVTQNSTCAVPFILWLAE